MSSWTVMIYKQDHSITGEMRDEARPVSWKCALKHFHLLVVRCHYVWWRHICQHALCTFMHCTNKRDNSILITVNKTRFFFFFFLNAKRKRTGKHLLDLSHQICVGLKRTLTSSWTVLSENNLPHTWIFPLIISSGKIMTHQTNTENYSSYRQGSCNCRLCLTDLKNSFGLTSVHVLCINYATASQSLNSLCKQLYYNARVILSLQVFFNGKPASQSGGLDHERQGFVYQPGRD